MINLNEPFTFENSSNPWLMDKVDDSNVLIFNGKKYTAKYLWSLNSEERKSALKNVFEYYRKNGFPKIVFEEKTLHENFEKLCKYDENKVLTKDGFISNSGNLCLDLCKYFCQDCYYDAKGGEKKTLSIKEVFNNDELFIKRLVKNIDQIICISENPRFEDRIITDLKNFCLVGEIVGLWRERM